MRGKKKEPSITEELSKIGQKQQPDRLNRFCKFCVRKILDKLSRPFSDQRPFPEVQIVPSGRYVEKPQQKMHIFLE